MGTIRLSRRDVWYRPSRLPCDAPVQGSSCCAKVRDLEDTIDNRAGATPAVVAETEETPSPAAPVTRQLDTSTVKLTANLAEDKMARQQRSIERLRADPHGFVNRYRVEFRDHFNPDNAAELFSDYCSSPENRAKYRTAVAGAAGWVSDEAFKQRLAEPDETPVLFTAGGTASGKSRGNLGKRAQVPAPVASICTFARNDSQGSSGSDLIDGCSTTMSPPSK